MKLIAILFLSLQGLMSQASEISPAHSSQDLEVVPYVDLQRYLGTWYEIARLPNSFQKNCVGTTATYSMREDGDIKVENRCYKGSFDGKLDEAIGKAWVTDPQTNAKLKVRFFWPFSGKYWIVDLDPDYQVAMVGEPSRKYLWILSRETKLNEGTYQALLEKAQKLGFDTSKMILTPQKD